MIDADKMKPGKRRSNPGKRRKRMSKKEREEGRKASLLRYKLARVPPPTPMMLRPIEAWRILCARTGTSMCTNTFYNWIRNSSVPAVRLGQKIFIPKVVLEELIERCLKGESP